MRELLRMVHGRAQEALTDYNLELYRGDILYIQGLEDSGIRTLAKVFAGDVPLQSGRLYLHGKQVSDYNRNTAYQYRIYTITADQELVETMTVAENLEAVRHRPLSLRLYHPRRAKKAVQAYLEREQAQIGATEYPFLLSQKEQKKLSILKAKMHGASLIVLDAINGIYEGREARELLELIQRANQEGITFVILSRSYTPFAEIATRIQIMDHGMDVKEWGAIKERIRRRLQSPAGEDASYKQPFPAATAADGLGFTGLYDYEWELQGDIWAYLSYVKRHSPRVFFELFGRVEVPNTGEGYKDGMAVIPRNSADTLVCNLDIADNLLLPIPGRVGKGILGVIPKDVRENIFRSFCKSAGVAVSVREISKLSRVHKKMLSIYRWELYRPEILLLESPYSGLLKEEAVLLRAYLARVQGRGIRVLYFSKLPEEFQEDCSRIFCTENGKNARIATVSQFFPPQPRQES